VTITLLCQIPDSGLGSLAREQGPGGTVLCAPQPAAVATAQRVFPDRRIEVKKLYAEPELGKDFRAFPSLALLAWMLFPGAGAEAPEEARRRVIDTSVRLIEISKSQEDAVLVAGPALLRLMAFKLNAIGYTGGFLTGFSPGERRVYRYQV
jgi:hypothetical protein